ncbi:hypothetical protein [Burkholderia anthina]|nr:hypothetical protein [Burkholderia anthina]
MSARRAHSADHDKAEATTLGQLLATAAGTAAPARQSGVVAA